MIWYLEEGPESDVVISTRVRLARNLDRTPFPWRLKPEALEEVRDKVTGAFRDRCLDQGEKGLVVKLDDLDRIKLDAMAERRIISPKMTRDTCGKALLLFPDENRGILVNEEDHMRVYAVEAGFKLKEAADRALACAGALGKLLPLARSEKLGYLTACPSNTGTGMRASAMLHLPGLVRMGVMGDLTDKLAKTGYALRGAGGEGTSMEADLIQVSNQVTLGVTEEEILADLGRLVMDLVREERRARQKLYDRDPLALEDEIGRAFGLLKEARLMGSKEAKSLLSLLRLGRELDLKAMPDYPLIQQLLSGVGKGAVQEGAGRNLDPRERDEWRARFIRRTLAEGLKKDDQ